MVAKHEGKTYAFNNKCPHLGLSLKRGEVCLITVNLPAKIGSRHRLHIIAPVLCPRVEP